MNLGKGLGFVSGGSVFPLPHVLATTGPHTGSLPLADLAPGVRGNIIQRGAADWETLAVGAAGEVLESGGAAADVVWQDPAGRYDPAAHALATTGPHNAPLPLVDLEVAVQGEIIHRGAADWETLGVGAANDVLISGGAGADVSWGPPAAPGAHALATTGPHNAPLPLIDLEVGVQGEVIHRGAADWEALAVGAAGEALLSGGAAADVSWGAPAPAAHEGSHRDGGADELEIDDLPGAAGAAGEIVESDGAALSFVEPDGRYQPAAHAGEHEPGGGDVMAVDAAAGTGSLRTLGGGATQAAPGDHTHTLTAEAESITWTTLAPDSYDDYGAKLTTLAIAGGAEIVYVTKTDTFSVTSKALAGLGGYFSASDANTLKLKLYMGGVQVAETGFIGDKTEVQGNRSLSGSQVVEVKVKNYDGGAVDFKYFSLVASDTFLFDCLIVGSVAI